MFNPRAEIAIEERTQASSEGTEAVHPILERIQFMFRLSAHKIAVAASALLLCAGFAQAQNPPASPLTVTWTGSPSPVAVGYDLSTSTALAAVTLTITATNATIFDVDPATVPYWLTVGAMNGTTNTTLTFQANSNAAALGVDSYSASVHLKVSSFADAVVPVTLSVTNGSNSLSVKEANAGAIAMNWVYGSGPLTQTLTIVSSGQPVAFTIAAVNTTNPATVHENVPANWISLSAPSGIASSFGTPIVVSFLSDVLNNAAVGASLTGTVTITYTGTGSPLTVNLTITVTQPFATVKSIVPAQAPPSAATPLSVVVTGSGFTSGTTTVNIGYTGDGGSAVPLTGAQVQGTMLIVNPTTMILSIPAADKGTPPNPILASGDAITLQVTNSLPSEPAAAETTTLTITSNPIIDSITDAAAMVEPASGMATNVAPYELVTIFGSNFDLNAGAAGTPVKATLDAFGRYPSTLTVPAAGGSALTVGFYNSTVTPKVLIANAYLVYVSNTQINALVPSGVVAKGITQVEVVVTYNGNNSTAFNVTPVAANPGIFTVGADGLGQGAILLPNFSVNSATNEATLGSTVMIYVSGLGAPTSTGADKAGKSAPKAPGSCISAASYFAAVNALTPAPGTLWTSDDGAVILESNLATNDLPPCFASAPTVNIGGQNATVTYAGWVADSVAGLYQINATVPTKATTGTAVPVVVTFGGVSSQAGVTMAIQ
jgi:uncharacterized protein (TIGR03437 family)